ncbi:MAG: helix-turn-helix domain containing protein [Chitinophagales bacterium]|nr:helix-turn-helix domain containing protein [Chitinophagales bacterium]
MLIILVGTYSCNTCNTQKEVKETTPTSFQRDEKVENQILREDYRNKVIDMLRRGMSVSEISQQTGLRKDLIRQIKKEYEQQNR